MGSAGHLQHYTPRFVVEEFILPRLLPSIYDYVWVDLFAGTGNLILPILKQIPQHIRPDFFKHNVYMFDINPDNIDVIIDRLSSLGVPKSVAKENVFVLDTIEDFPHVLVGKEDRVFHVTNPPYLYRGQMRGESKKFLKYFENRESWLQDLYQVAMFNDLRRGFRRMVYVVPVNFLFGGVGSVKARMNFLKYYRIDYLVVVEDRIFETTGQNVMVVFFSRKEKPCFDELVFEGVKVRGGVRVGRKFVLKPQHGYRSGGEFWDFVSTRQNPSFPSFRFYLTMSDLERNRGRCVMRFVDANRYERGRYGVFEYGVSEEFCELIRHNDLWLRTVDTGGADGRAGLYFIHDHFNADAIVATKSTTRTQPIQIIFSPPIKDKNERLKIVHHFNTTLEHLRTMTDSEFMTTYKYSRSSYTRKYLGLGQAKLLLKTYQGSPNQT